MIPVAQAEFAQAILDPYAEVPEGLANPDGAAASKRFDVYRNNVVGSLIRALNAAFPVLRKLLGVEFFEAMAGIHARECLPRSPLLMYYGEDMPAFLERFEPVAHRQFLPDVARLELAMRRSYHAADVEPMAPETIAAHSPDQLMSARVILAPAVELVRSRWPIFGIWGANAEAEAPEPEARAEDVLITRRQFDPEPALLPPGGAAFVEALKAGHRISEAVDEGLAAAQEFDLAAALGVLIGGDAITEICEGNEQ